MAQAQQGTSTQISAQPPHPGDSDIADTDSDIADTDSDIADTDYYDGAADFQVIVFEIIIKSSFLRCII